ncbi:Uncharacterised protein [Nocardia africana]|uniref:Uncharacterized protein n=1 Tax=Nocardia africana TaxID=134964 RepID=A0A378X628_9NOCA|nr:Uncharacterised protein [Nocardia africana]
MWEIEQLNADQLRTMFGVERGSLGTPGFPGSERDGEGVERWPADQVWQWVASRQPVAAAITPLRHWARGEAVYLQAREIPGGVAQDWSIHGVVLRVVWPTVEVSASAAVAEAAANLAPWVPTVIKVRHDFGIWGPSLAVHDDAGIRLDDDEPVWPELALVLGGRAPYWPPGIARGVLDAAVAPGYSAGRGGGRGRDRPGAGAAPGRYSPRHRHRARRVARTGSACAVPGQ